jgi:proline dehydrogenase
MRLKKSLAWLITLIGKYAASSYIAGPELDDAKKVCESLTQLGLRLTICPWDLVGTPAREVLDSYLEALAGIEEMKLDCYLSVKLPSMAYDLGMVREMLCRAANHGTRIHFDSLAPDTIDRSLDVIARLRAEYDNLSWTLPSRWRRSAKDLERIIDLRLPVRIVKGQFEELPDREINPRTGFLDLVDRAAASRLLTAVATHDENLARESLQRLTSAKVPCELEQLFGLPRGAEQHAANKQVPIRIYVPYSCGYLPYALSGMMADPRKILWLIRDALRRRPQYKCRPSPSGTPGKIVVNKQESFPH